MQLRWDIQSSLFKLLLLVGLAADALILLRGVGNLTLLTLLLVPAIVAGLYQYAKLSRILRLLYGLFLIVTILNFGSYILQIMIFNVDTLYESDFFSFWFNGRVGVQGLNFYDPANYRDVSAGMILSDYFTGRLINTAFWYPPLAILLFIPLGLFSMQTAWIIWYVLLTITFLLNIWLIHKLFLPQTGWAGVGALTALLVIMYPTHIVFRESQTNYLLSLFILLLWRDRDKAAAGIWLALALVIKPLVAPLLLCFVIWRQWGALVSMTVTLAALSLVVILISGMETFLSYNPFAKLPPTVYSEAINQGVLATIVRLTNHPLDQSPIMNPLFLLISLVLTLITVFLIYRLPAIHKQWSVFLALTLALLIYPTSLHHYGTLLMLPLAVFILDDSPFVGGQWGKVGFMALAIMLLSLQYGAYSFIPFAATWLVVARIAFAKLNPNPLPTLGTTPTPAEVA